MTIGLEFDFDVFAIDSYGVVRDVSRGRRAEYRSARDVEDGAVPRAGYLSTHNHSLGERPAPMRTGIVNRIERSVDIEERDASPSDVHCHPRTGSDVARSGNLDELAHSRTPFAAHHTPVTSSGREHHISSRPCVSARDVQDGVGSVRVLLQRLN